MQIQYFEANSNKNTGKTSPGLSDSFLWSCKVTVVKAYVKLQMAA